MSDNLKGVPVEGFAEKSREAAVEGAVLLKNENNVLPLTKEDKVSVFGRPLIEYYRSGTGSGGAVNVEYATNILDGFNNSDITINEDIVNDYKEWLKEHPFDNETFRIQTGYILRQYKRQAYSNCFLFFAKQYKGFYDYSNSVSD